MKLATTREEERYVELTARSRELWERARHVEPGGDTRSSVFWQPYPLFISRGKGSDVWDADGTRRADFVHNVTSVFLGHSHPSVVSALEDQSSRGTAFAGPTEVQVEFAEELCGRLPSFSSVRFTNSGTEATLNCLRAARACTGRTKFAKVEGAYHGSHDAVSFSVRPDLKAAGPRERPRAVPEYPSMPAGLGEDIVILPYNDVASARQIIAENAHELAAVIVEPCLGSAGTIPATRDYLVMLREETLARGIVLIFDEVVTFRAARGGAQEIYGIKPDITALGKVIGGGLPVGAFGGSEQLMSLFDPTGSQRLVHSGTFQANPMTSAAGLATLRGMTATAIADVNGLTEELADGVRRAAERAKVPVQVLTFGSLFGIHFTDHPVTDYRSAAAADADLKRQVFFGMLNDGVYVRPTLTGALAHTTTKDHVADFVRAFASSLARAIEGRTTPPA